MQFLKAFKRNVGAGAASPVLGADTVPPVRPVASADNVLAVGKAGLQTIAIATRHSTGDGAAAVQANLFAWIEAPNEEGAWHKINESTLTLTPGTLTRVKAPQIVDGPRGGNLAPSSGGLEVALVVSDSGGTDGTYTFLMAPDATPAQVTASGGGGGGGEPSGTAGGALTGTYPDPGVNVSSASISGVLPTTKGGTGVNASTTVLGDVGKVLRVTAAGVMALALLALGDTSGNLAESRITPGTNGHVLTTVAGVATWAAPSGGGGAPANYPLGGALSGTTDAAVIVPGTNGQILTTAGGVTTWAAPSYPANYALAGDLSGTTAAAVVAKINGATVPASPAGGDAGKALLVSGANALVYGTNFGAQPLTTTGALAASGATLSGLAGTGTRVPTVSSAGLLGALANGTDGHVLTLTAGAPTWAAAVGGGTLAGDVTGPIGTNVVTAATGVGGVFNVRTGAVLTFGNPATAAAAGTVRAQNNQGWHNLNAAGNADLRAFIIDATDTLILGNSTGATQLDGLTWALQVIGATTLSATTTEVTVAQNLVIMGGAATSVPTTGAIRLLNNAFIVSRSVAGTVNYPVIGVDNLNNLQIGSVSNSGMIVSAGTSLSFVAAGITRAQITANGIVVGFTGSFGGGTDVICYKNATVAPTSNPVNAALTYAAGGIFCIRPATASCINFMNPATSTTVGVGGGATAPPLTPLGYFTFQNAGVDVKVPFYNT